MSKVNVSLYVTLGGIILGKVLLEVGLDRQCSQLVLCLFTGLLGRFLRVAEVLVFLGVVYTLDGMWVWVSVQLVVCCCLISD